MSYITTYADENGEMKSVTISDEDSIEALRNDYSQLIHRYNPKYVTIRRMQVEPGEAVHLRVTLNAPTHYLTKYDSTNPIACNSMSADVVMYMGYPLKPIHAFYNPDHYLASPNVFYQTGIWGKACIDRWIVFSSSMISTVDKLLNDMIHNPTVTRYDSAANPNLIEWHKKGVEMGCFPTINPKLLYASENNTKSAPPIPPRRNQPTPPPIPKRR